MTKSIALYPCWFMLNTMNKYIHGSSGLISRHFIEHSSSLGQLLYWHNQHGINIQVREHQQLRWLLINNTLQSVILTRSPQVLLFPHLAYLATVWQQRPAPKKILELGLGGGAIRNFLLKQYPQAQLTSVEKNPHIIDCYQDFFALNEQGQIYCEDAQTVLKSVVNIDWIILDLFSELDAPRVLFDLCFYQTIYEALAQRGILFINFLSQHSSQLTQLQLVLKRVFGEAVSIKKITGFVNHIVVVEKTL